MSQRPSVSMIGVRGRGGFTLTELLVVIVIIVVLISILLPAVGGARNRARAAATSAFMATVHQSIGQFRAAEQRLPGYFPVKDVGNAENIVERNARVWGLTYGENALLELAGGVTDKAEDTANSPGVTPVVIRVGVGAGKEVNVDRLRMGSADGPGYLEMPEGFVDLGGGLTDGRAGTRAHHKWMPRLIDSWGMPILMWPRDEFAKHKLPLVEEAFNGNPDETSAAFYWAGNSAFTNGPRLGKGTQKSQWTLSTLSSDVAGNGARNDTLSGVVGHTAFPDPLSLGSGGEPRPLEPRGDVVLQSAGSGGVYMESKGGQFDRYHYVPDGFDLISNKPTWLNDETNFIEKSDDLILSGS